MLERFPFRTMQITIALLVGWGSIWFQQANDYPINPYITGAWCFMCAYGATMLVVKLADWRELRLSRRIDAGTGIEKLPDDIRPL